MKNSPKAVTFRLGLGSIDAGVEFYSALIGRPPDFVPHENFVEWEVADNAWLQLNSDRDVAVGNGSFRMVVADIESALDRAVAKLAVARAEVETRDEVPVFWCTLHF